MSLEGSLFLSGLIVSLAGLVLLARASSAEGFVPGITPFQGQPSRSQLLPSQWCAWIMMLAGVGLAASGALVLFAEVMVLLGTD